MMTTDGEESSPPVRAGEGQRLVTGATTPPSPAPPFRLAIARQPPHFARVDERIGDTSMTSQAIAEPISVNEGYVELMVQRRVGGRIRDLRIETRPGGIILQGRATTYHAKQLAQHAAMELCRQPILA